MGTIPEDTKPLSPRLERNRNVMIRLIYEMKIAKKGEPLSEVITCDKCPNKHTCVSAFDIYNTDGDCLEDK
jgi:hypothetical protein